MENAFDENGQFEHNKKVLATIIKEINDLFLKSKVIQGDNELLK